MTNGLVVDDEPDIRLLLVTVLEATIISEGYWAAFATDVYRPAHHHQEGARIVRGRVIRPVAAVRACWRVAEHLPDVARHFRMREISRGDASGGDGLALEAITFGEG